MKKISLFLFTYFVLPINVFALDYVPLSGDNSPLGSLKTNDVNTLLDSLFKWGISIAVILATLVLIWGGFLYMTTDAVGKKEDGKNKIKGALGGLILALSSWAILNTINPTILSTPLDFSGLRSEGGAGGDNSGGGGGNNGTNPDTGTIPNQEITDLYDPTTDIVNRNSFIDQVNSDDALRDKFIRLANAEVGGYGEDALIAFYETAMNRAALANPENPTDLNNILVEAYYEPLKNGGNSKFRNPSSSDYATAQNALNKALAGSNRARGRTHAGQMSDSYIINNWQGDPNSFIKIGPTNQQETFYSKTIEGRLPWYR